MKNNAKSLFLISLIICLFSCRNHDTIFEKRVVFKNNSWNRFEILKFNVQVEDTIPEYDIYCTVRHASFYPYSNLLINFSLSMPNSEERVQEHNLKLRAKNGTFLGNGMGDIWDISIPLMTHFTFPHAGDFHFEVENLMTKYETEGIMEFGLIIIRSDSKHKL